MINVIRSKSNPILSPNPKNEWEADSVFNASVVNDGNTYHMFYRAVSGDRDLGGIYSKFSSIGYAKSNDGVHFEDRREFITPDSDFDRYGCEDPRVTKFGDTYYIFYTAISTHPPNAAGIKVAVAKTRYFKKVEEKHPVTFFNAKAMTMFPEKINGKIGVILTTHTDMPPAHICYAALDREEDLWNEQYWEEWYERMRETVIPFYRTHQDQVEVGATPILTDKGWLVIYCYVQNYFGTPKLFRIDAAILDRDNPQKVLGQTHEPILVPEEDYEIYGKVPNVIFPSGAIVEKGELRIYYGGADTRVCMAQMPLTELFGHIHETGSQLSRPHAPQLVRYEKNPILSPSSDRPWATKFTFNPGAVSLGGKVHLFFRAMGGDGVSVLGYAATTDGYNLTEVSKEPVYGPRELFEKQYQGGDSGCEDPRLCVVDNSVVMLYTAYDGTHPPRVAITSIDTNDFLGKKWSNWKTPQIISPPGLDDKDACVFPEKIRGKYAFFHRINPNIWLDYSDSLDFAKDQWLGGHPILHPRPNSWDSERIGIGPGPIKTDKGWLLIYHGMSRFDKKYRLGAVLLDLEDPSRVISRFNDSILEPDAPYELSGLRPNTVFSNGAVVLDGKLFVYYGAGDMVCAVASLPLNTLLTAILKGH